MVVRFILSKHRACPAFCGALLGLVMTKNRDTYFDVLRGLAIIGVVAIHSDGIGYRFENARMDFIGTACWRQFVNFSVPLFLAISGYFLAKKSLRSREDYVRFLKKQIPRVFVPFLLWSIFYSIHALISGTPLKTIIYRFLTFQSSVPFYFILLIMQYYLLLPILQRIATIRGLVLSGFISMVSCLVIFYVRYHTAFQLPLYLYAGAFPTWLVFFVLGIFLADRPLRVGNRPLISFVIIGYALSLAETYFLYDSYNKIEYSVTAVKVSSFLYSASLILLLFNRYARRTLKSKVLLYIGEISFGIYLSHMFFLRWIDSYLHTVFSIDNPMALVNQALVILFTIACCSAISIILRLVNKRVATLYLGQ